MACFNSIANMFMLAGQRTLELMFSRTPSPSLLRWDRPLNGAVLPNQPSMWKIKSEWKVNSKTLGLSATAISRSVFIPQYVTRETAIVVQLRKSFCRPTSYQKQNEKRKVKMRRYQILSFLFSSHRWIRSKFKKEKTGCSSYCGRKRKPRKIPLFTKKTQKTSIL